jgi:hypothetical protein
MKRTKALLRARKQGFCVERSCEGRRELRLKCSAPALRYAIQEKCIPLWAKLKATDAKRPPTP